MRRKKIKVPIYDRTLIITVAKNFHPLVRKIDKLDDDDDAESTVIEDKHGRINLFIKPNANINTICHEAFHITTGILQDAGCKLTDSSEESYAYLIGWISNKIDKELRK